MGQYIFKRLAAAIAIGHALEKFKDLWTRKISVRRNVAGPCALQHRN
jgi:hypothetical protein